MSYAIDTNVLARSIETAHPMQPVAGDAVLVSRGETVCVLPQNLYEFWVIATRPRDRNGLGLSAVEAQAHLAQFERVFSLLSDVPAIYAGWKRLVGEHLVMGKNAHDARILAAMKVHRVSLLSPSTAMISSAFRESSPP